jgi:hypothetical protein
MKVYWTMSFHYIIWIILEYHVINLKFFISKNEFFQQKCEKCEVIENLTSNHMHMEDDKHN